MPDWSTGRGPTKCSQCLFCSRNQAAILWQVSLSTLWQNIVSGTHNCEWQNQASWVCYCGATEQHSSRHAHAFRWIKRCVGPEGNVYPGQAFVPKFRPVARRFCNLMMYNNNRKQTLADRGLLLVRKPLLLGWMCVQYWKSGTLWSSSCDRLPFCINCCLLEY